MLRTQNARALCNEHAGVVPTGPGPAKSRTRRQKSNCSDSLRNRADTSPVGSMN